MSEHSGSVIASLRKLISDGQYAPGTRLAETSVAEQLGVSRTPVRLAFRTLEQEGLLQKAGKRGFLVREFSDEDVLCAVEVRGVLEGLAARRLVEHGVSEEVRSCLLSCLEGGTELLAKGHITEDDIVRWSALNGRFHAAIVDAARSSAIRDAIARNNHLPFASADSIIINTGALQKDYEKLRLAHLQHQLVFDALECGEAARAEMLMREHAYIGLRYDKLLGPDRTPPHRRP